jgi:hypothetical protein
MNDAVCGDAVWELIALPIDGGDCRFQLRIEMLAITRIDKQMGEGKDAIIRN